ncbi:alkaline phosphatase [Kordiimonas sp. SCSIO 12610]|uniref:alkaline phosphatase D family protein n=1 Tax=Kordiimonas sp. SCSIO 12610 TaxID=2829597 RepID=UPI00210C3022|nr:alkaline phosphatase D family protein [Kordiimonas sp. SCSIO 12610]UTW55770.1 alkaline phosphatase D family protein [Kordiimonas sp. SCSIO 12610]
MTTKHFSPNRRAVLAGIGATFGAIALRGHEIMADAAAHFTHGIASGDPLSDRVIIWTRVIPGSGENTNIDGTWEVAKDKAFKSVVSKGGFTTGADRDYTVKIDATGLAPNTKYYYRFVSQAIKSPIGRTKTLPVGQTDKVNFAVVSCSNYPQGYFNVYGEIAKRDVDAVIHLGDYIYEYADGVYSNPEAVKKGRKVQPTHEITKLEDYRMRYGLYRTDKDLQAIHQAHPFINVWDDHEISNDTWKDGAENHNEGEGPFDARRRAAIQAFYEWIPIRENDPELTGEIYRTFNFGDLASLIMMDTRLIGRDEQLSYQKDLPFRKIPFDFSDPENPKALLSADAFKAANKATIKEIQVPFDLTKGQPVPVTDWSKIKSFDPQNLPKGLSYIPDAETFKRDILGNEKRSILGEKQEKWLAQELAATKSRPWQILGQQLLMGKINVPKLDPKDIDVEKSKYLTEQQIGFFRILEQLNLPLNLDAWDGYHACRERVFGMIKKHGSNCISIAGDTHNAWAFDLSNDAGEAIAVELATPGVSSPGMEAYLPVETSILTKAMLDKNPELKYLNGKDRGWMEIALTQEEVTSNWYYVSTVLETTYDVIDGPTLIVKNGAHKIG